VLKVKSPANIALHDDGSRERLPWSAKESLCFWSQRVVQWVGGNGVALEDDPTWLAPVSPALRRDDALLVLHRLTHDRLAVLEHHVLVPKGVAPGFFFFPFSYFFFF
jgi:hypothetical protein